MQKQQERKLSFCLSRTISRIEDILNCGEQFAESEIFRILLSGRWRKVANSLVFAEQLAKRETLCILPIFKRGANFLERRDLSKFAEKTARWEISSRFFFSVGASFFVLLLVGDTESKSLGRVEAWKGG